MKRFRGVEDIAKNDPYKIRGYDIDAFDYIIDIGSNTGQFALTAYFLFPDTPIFSYEPCIATYKVLCDNMQDIPNITKIPIAIGDGSPLYFQSSGGRATCTGNLFKKEDTGNYSIKSATIDKVFKDNQIELDKNILLKLDCEGGEQYVLVDRYKYILLSCKHLSIEVHFKCSRNSKTSENFKDLPEWNHYNDWIQDTFKNSHDILYHKSNKAFGLGVYVLTRKT